MELLLLLLLLLLALFLLLRRRSRKEPPGLPSLPLVGSIPFMDISKGVLSWSLDARITAHRLFSVTLGTRTTYVINDFDLCKQLFEKEEFSGRPVDKGLLRHRFQGPVPLGIIHTEGAHWTTQRRFSLKTLKDFGFGRKSIEESIHFEVDEMIDTNFTSDQDILLTNDFNIPIINVLWQMVANKRFSSTQARDLALIESVSFLFESGRQRDKYPAFVQNLLPMRIYKMTPLGKRLKHMNNIREHLASEVQDHQANLDTDNPKDFIDVYLTSVLEDKQEGLTVADLSSVIWDFFMAGTETSSTTLKWVVLYLVLHQDVQDRCREEIRRVLGSSQVASADMPRLPFLQAVIAEVQRVAFIAPTSLFHKTLTPTSVEGFTFPKGSVFVANLSFFMNDPKHFESPREFNPDRFLSEDGRFVKNERLVPFGLGKRYCMGELLARNEVFLFAASLVQHVKLLPPDHHPSPSPDNFMCNLTRIPNNFHLKVVKV